MYKKGKCHITLSELLLQIELFRQINEHLFILQFQDEEHKKGNKKANHFIVVQY